jgi:hypothetical protein
MDLRARRESHALCNVERRNHYKGKFSEINGKGFSKVSLSLCGKTGGELRQGRNFADG